MQPKTHMDLVHNDIGCYILGMSGTGRYISHPTYILLLPAFVLSLLRTLFDPISLLTSYFECFKSLHSTNEAWVKNTRGYSWCFIFGMSSKACGSDVFRISSTFNRSTSRIRYYCISLTALLFIM